MWSDCTVLATDVSPLLGVLLNELRKRTILVYPSPAVGDCIHPVVKTVLFKMEKVIHYSAAR